MHKPKYLLLFTCFFLLWISSCKEETNNPLPGTDIPPVPVTNVQIKSIPGGAVITYSLPANRSVQYVEAEWKDEKGNIQSAKASAFGNSLKLEGFGDTLEHNIQLYSVNNKEKKSAPLNISIQPLTPPLVDVFKSLSVNADFGGCYVSFENTLGANVMIGIITPDSTGVMDNAYGYYTAQKEGHFSLRGYPPVEREFGFYVRDQWGNYSDTLFKKIIPEYEEFLDKSKFQLVNNIPGDLNGNIYSPSNPIPFIWDNNINTWMATWTNGSVLPNQSITIDLGVSVKLSRFRIWQRQDYPEAIYGISNLKKLEVWGRTDPPVGNGDWSNWTKLMDCEIIKPSGLPPGQLSNDDMEGLLAGDEFIAPVSAPVIRYIRLKFIETWGGTPYCNFGEISLWGAIQ